MAAPKKEPAPGDLPQQLSQPAIRALKGAGLTSLEKVSKWSEKDVAALHGIGNNALIQLKEALRGKGLKFG